MKNSDYWSSFEDEMLDWREVYNLSDRDDYEMCSDYSGYDDVPCEPYKQRRYDLDCFDFPTSFVSFDFENLFPQRVSACSVGMVKYKNGVIVDKFYTLIRPPFEYEGKRGPALTWIHGFTENDLRVNGILQKFSLRWKHLLKTFLLLHITHVWKEHVFMMHVHIIMFRPLSHMKRLWIPIFYLKQ